LSPRLKLFKILQLARISTTGLLLVGPRLNDLRLLLDYFRNPATPDAFVAVPRLSRPLRVKIGEVEREIKMKKPQIPLEQAFLCLDCSCISDGSRECPACSSRALLNLSTVLNRPCELSFQIEAGLEAVAA
jgi:hypothetical protein